MTTDTLQQSIPSFIAADGTPQGFTIIPPVENGEGFRLQGPQHQYGGTGHSAPWRGGGKGVYGRRRRDYRKEMKPQETCEGFSGEQLYKPSFSQDPWEPFYTKK